jgi:uncharacterized protein (DUF488 family)
MSSVVYTVGHSNHASEEFLALLKVHGITAIADVRSRPYSRYNPQFDRETLKVALATEGIQYVFLGGELGARSSDPACYERGVVQFERLARAEEFKAGLRRVLEGAAQYRIALMCAEKEPLECHRTILVARQLAALGATVIHIHADGQLETHGEALSRLAKMLRVREDEMHLFRSAEDLVEDLYRMQEARIAYEAEGAEEPAA